MNVAAGPYNARCTVRLLPFTETTWMYSALPNGSPPAGVHMITVSFAANAAGFATGMTVSEGAGMCVAVDRFIIR